MTPVVEALQERGIERRSHEREAKVRTRREPAIDKDAAMRGDTSRIERQVLDVDGHMPRRHAPRLRITARSAKKTPPYTAALSTRSTARLTATPMCPCRL